jgi:GNAT superfamily N-acetyltransferase
LSIQGREQFWAEELGKPQGGSVTFVALDDAGEVVGFVSGGVERTGELGCDGELYAIYLIERMQRRGLGTLMVKRLARELRARGFASMAVWVLAQNPFRKFYEALGGKYIREQIIERSGQEFVEVAYGLGLRLAER